MKIMKIGDRIKKRRIECGMSANDLASLLGKNRSTIYRYENNEIENLPTDILEPLAQALHTSPAYLMGWTNDPNANRTSQTVPAPKREQQIEQNPAFFRLKQGLEPYNLSEADADFLLAVYEAHLKKNHQG